VNRIPGKSYSDYANPNATPWVSYSYQTGTYFLSSVGGGAVTHSYSNYDALGLPGISPSGITERIVEALPSFGEDSAFARCRAPAASSEILPRSAIEELEWMALRNRVMQRW
jgi:hypothetical protein